MAELSRRLFLSGALSVAAAAVTNAPVLAGEPKAAPLPILYGDGVHDDADALNALLSGRPFFCDNQYILASNGEGWVHLANGLFRIGKTIKVTRDYTTIVNTMFITTPDFESPRMLVIDADFATLLGNLFHNIHVDMRETASALRVPEGAPRSNGSLIGGFRLQTA